MSDEDPNVINKIQQREIVFPYVLKYYSGVYIREKKGLPEGSQQDKLNFVKEWFNIYLHCFENNEDSMIGVWFYDEIIKPFEFLTLDPDFEKFFDEKIFKKVYFVLPHSNKIDNFNALVNFSLKVGKDSRFDIIVFKLNKNN